MKSFTREIAETFGVGVKACVALVVAVIVCLISYASFIQMQRHPDIYIVLGVLLVLGMILAFLLGLIIRVIISLFRAVTRFLKRNPNVPAN